jgi:hypothetical protein
MENKIKAIYCLIDDVLKKINHTKDVRRKRIFTKNTTETQLEKTCYKRANKTETKNEKRIEATTSVIKKLLPQTIHVVMFQGFLLKLICFICVE